MDPRDRPVRWQGYLVAGLAGVFLASAVILPLSRSRVREERLRAEAAEQEAAEARAELQAVNEAVERVSADSYRELMKTTLKLLDDEPDPQRRKELEDWLRRMAKKAK